MVRRVTETAADRPPLSEADGRFRLLVDAVFDYAIYLLDPTGIVVSWNSGAERFKGYKSPVLCELLDVSPGSVTNSDVWREWNPLPAKRAKPDRK